MTLPIRWQMKKELCDAYEAKNQTSSALHGHYHFLLTLITRGEGVQTLNGTDKTFSKGDMFFLSPADFHKNKVESGKSYDYYGVKFPYGLLDKRLSALLALDKLPMVVHLSGADYLTAEDIFKRLIDESCFGEERIANHIYMQNLVEQLIIIAVRGVSGDGSEESSEFVNRALGYLYSHFYEDITVSDAAKHMGYTPNYFNSKFRESLGVPFGEYLRNMRLTYAANLLKSGNMSITEVAVESGFGNSAHFSRTFREKHGMSPKDYKKLQVE